MKNKLLVLPITILVAFIALIALFWFAGETRAAVHAVPSSPNADPTVTDVQPNNSPNDVDNPIVVQGTGFSATLSGTQVITAPTVYLGETELADVAWGSTTTLSATVPWGLSPQVYTLTVVNPDGISATLSSAFTVTQGIGVWTTNGPYGGEIVQVRINPHDPATLYAVAQGMGLLRSTDSAANWEPMLFNLNPPEQISVDAGNPDVLYAGGGSPWRSSDGGDSWEILTVHPSIPFIGRNYRLTADPSHSGVVFAAASDSKPPGLTGSILRSENFGQAGSWVTITHEISDTDFIRVAIHPDDSNIILGGTEGGNLYYTLNAGTTWNHAFQLGNPVYGLYFNSYEPLEAWAVGKDATFLYKSTDLITWNPVSIDPGHHGESNNLDMAFLPDTIWVSNWEVYTSTDGGANWTGFDWHGAPPDPLSIAIHPNRPGKIYTGDFTDGIYKSADGGQSWQLASNGLAGLNPSAVVVAPDDPATVYAKVDFGLIKSEDGGQTWRSLDFARGGYAHRTKLAIDPFQPGRIYFGYSDDEAPLVWIHDNGGEDPQGWISATAALPPAYSGWSGRFYTLAPDPNVSGRIFAGIFIFDPNSDQEGGLIYGSDDYGLTWEHLGPGQPTSWVIEFAFDSQNTNLIYAATRESGLWRSNDGGQNWALATDPSGYNNLEFVATHPQTENMIYVHAAEEDSQDSGGLFVSYDAGETWTHLTWQAGNQLLFIPTEPLSLLTGCGWGEEFGGGVCQSWDDGQSWIKLNGISFPTAMATGTDDHRIITYIGTPGGMVTSSDSNQATKLENGIATTNNGYTAFGGGVYRLTTLLPTDWIYLPLVLRGHAP